ncbi:MAG: protein-disulfide reductase DsbD family protein, partial [Spirochaetaceae bacterium]|nr:protein-disulfide reductase DsbD family protein [Spirochaetaceae bacterium]
MIRVGRAAVPLLGIILAFAAPAAVVSEGALADAGADADAAPWGTSALSGSPRATNRVRVDLRASASGIAPSGSVELALTLDHEDGWHSYWINPGDAGLPTTIEWILPRGFAVENTRWPTPLRIEDRGAVSFGYAGIVSVLATLRAPASIPEGQELEIEARVSLLACKELCVAETSVVLLRIGAGASKATGADGAFFSRAASRLPERRAAGQASISADGSAILRIGAKPGSIEPGRAELSYFFPDEVGAF